MRCLHCDSPRPTDGPFCPSCGALTEEPPPIEDAPSVASSYPDPLPHATAQPQPPLPLSPNPLAEAAPQRAATAIPARAPVADLPRDTVRYRELLQDRFGYPDFRPGQAEVLEALATHDVLGVMPTGGGKSLCYVLPALEVGRTLVISPLIALMQDQVEALEAVGVPATFINSTLNRAEQNRRYADFEAGRIALLFIAPERLANRRFLDGLARGGVRLLVIDEAHCISEWGHDFRPDYLALGGAREQLGRPRTLALTATADPTVRRDILARLGIAPEAREVLTSFDRPNLRFQVAPIASARERLSWLVAYARERSGQSGIVYARTRRSVEETAETLNAAGVPAQGYHAGMGGAARATIQRRFTTGRAPLIVATNAFGLGIDKPDVRYVVHLQMPGRLEAYYQEAGRAGRDGEPAECTLLYSRRDHSLQRRFIDQAHPDDEVVRRSWTQLVAIQQLDPQRTLSPSEFEDAAGRDGWALTVKALRSSGLLAEGELRLSSLDPGAPIDTRAIAERRRYAESRLAQMAEYAETSGCRRELILRYFGEPQLGNGARSAGLAAAAATTAAAPSAPRRPSTPTISSTRSSTCGTGSPGSRTARRTWSSRSAPPARWPPTAPPAMRRCSRSGAWASGACSGSAIGCSPSYASGSGPTRTPPRRRRARPRPPVSAPRPSGPAPRCRSTTRCSSACASGGASARRATACPPTRCSRTAARAS